MYIRQKPALGGLTGGYTSTEKVPCQYEGLL